MCVSPFGDHQRCVKVLPLSSHLLKLRNIFARLCLVCCLHWLHVIFLKNKAHTVLRNNVFFEWWMIFQYSKYCLFKRITSMTRPCMQAAFVKFDKALEPQFVQKCFRSLQILSMKTLLYACALRETAWATRFFTLKIFVQNVLLFFNQIMHLDSDKRSFHFRNGTKSRYIIYT